MVASIPLLGPASVAGDTTFNGFKVTNLGTPTASTDAATKGYVDAKGPGIITGTGVAGRPVAPLAGQGYWRLDKNFLETYDGTNWRVFGTVVVSALTDITSPYTGQMVVHSGDHFRLWQYDGSTWVLFGLMTNQMTGGEWLTVTGPDQTLAAASTKLNFSATAAVGPFGDITFNGSNQWTVGSDGLYFIDLQLRTAAAVAGGPAIGLSTYADSTLLIPARNVAAGPWGDMGTSAPIWLTSGAIFCAWFYNNGSSTSVANTTRRGRLRVWKAQAAA